MTTSRDLLGEAYDHLGLAAALLDEAGFADSSALVRVVTVHIGATIAALDAYRPRDP